MIVICVRFIYVVSSIGFIKTLLFYRVSYLNVIPPFTFCHDVEPQCCPHKVPSYSVV